MEKAGGKRAPWPCFLTAHPASGTLILQQEAGEAARTTALLAANEPLDGPAERRGSFVCGASPGTPDIEEERIDDG
ncbi:MAG: hypothetical protein IH958_02165 [Chloroflexi bacterium]|nr:hypothetical protein [Chloroflexota bacterium]